MSLGRPANLVTTTTLTISTTPQIKHCLERLAASGAFGKSPAEAAERIIASAVQNLVREGNFLRSSDLKARSQSTA